VAAGRDPIEFVHEMIDRFESAIEEMAKIRTNGESGAVKVGATRVQIEAMLKQAELLQATGLLPRNLGALRAERDVRLVVAVIAEEFRRHKIPIRVIEGIQERLREVGQPVRV
jgi:hypothetical protein